MSVIDAAEIQVHCRQCNAYLYSIGPAEAQVSPEQDPSIVDCPMKLDAQGRCTGIWKRSSQ